MTGKVLQIHGLNEKSYFNKHFIVINLDEPLPKYYKLIRKLTENDYSTLSNIKVVEYV